MHCAVPNRLLSLFIGDAGVLGFTRSVSHLSGVDAVQIEDDTGLNLEMKIVNEILRN